MTTQQRNTIARIQASHEAQRFAADQAEIEGAALRGELGAKTQLNAMSAQYMELRAAGKFDEAKAVKAAALKIYEGQV